MGKMGEMRNDRGVLFLLVWVSDTDFEFFAGIACITSPTTAVSAKTRWVFRRG
jgi:hypothetical protein